MKFWRVVPGANGTADTVRYSRKDAVRLANTWNTWCQHGHVVRFRPFPREVA